MIYSLLKQNSFPPKVSQCLQEVKFWGPNIWDGVQTFSVKSSVTNLAVVLCVVAMFFMLAAHRCLFQPAWLLPGSYFTPLGCRARFKSIQTCSFSTLSVSFAPIGSVRSCDQLSTVLKLMVSSNVVNVKNNCNSTVIKY